jgi:trehalose 6-phosphate synthase
MNLVAKEFVAAQDPEAPGVLILSQFAGAAAELDGALTINPHEVEGVAAAIKRALEMPLEERRERHGPMLAHLLDHSVEQWSDNFLSTLGETRQRPSLIEGLRAMFGVSA